MISRMKCMLGGVVAALAVSAPFPSLAAFPDKPVTIVSPFVPGGGNDLVSRILAEGLRNLWGVPVLVENKSGAGGNIGTSVVAKSNPDGYTLLMGSLSYPINAHLYAKLPFDPVKDLVAVSLVASGSYALVSHPSLPVESVEDLVAMAKGQPGKLAYSSAGNGSGGHMGMEMFKAAANIDLLHVPYGGTAAAVNDTVAGQVMLLMDNIVAVGPQIKSNRLRALAVTSLKRSPLFPDVPTLDESSFKGFEVSPWFGLLAPSGTPPEAVAKISADAAKILAMPDVVERLRSLGAEPVGSTPEEFSAYLSSELEKWGKVVESTGARVD